MSSRLDLIAIDGPSGSGKSTTAKRTAERLGWSYLDTGAMYRATALALHRAGVELAETAQVKTILDQININQEGTSIFLDGENVSDAIRTMEINQMVTPVSADAQVREAMVRQQQRLGQRGRWVVDGRDIGTVVFPEAVSKIFLVASLRVRSERRFKELSDKGILTTLQEVAEDLERRDLADRTRAISPLRKAKDALEIDTSDRAVSEVVDLIVSHYEHCRTLP
ncbi:MAG: (d)CMP kinase [Holophagaceae bacterium]|nr:(d)CMP kinase [Acidobacteriota bacterium]